MDSASAHSQQQSNQALMMLLVDRLWFMFPCHDHSHQIFGRDSTNSAGFDSQIQIMNHGLLRSRSIRWAFRRCSSYLSSIQTSTLQHFIISSPHYLINTSTVHYLTTSLLVQHFDTSSLHRHFIHYSNTHCFTTRLSISLTTFWYNRGHLLPQHPSSSNISLGS